MVQLHIIKSARSLTRVASLFVIVASILIAANRSISAVIPAPYHPAEKSFTAAIWTIHFALDDDMWASEVRMRDVIKELELDVVGKYYIFSLFFSEELWDDERGKNDSNYIFFSHFC